MIRRDWGRFCAKNAEESQVQRGLGAGSLINGKKYQLRHPFFLKKFQDSIGDRWEDLGLKCLNLKKDALLFFDVSHKSWLGQFARLNMNFDDDVASQAGTVITSRFDEGASVVNDLTEKLQEGLNLGSEGQPNAEDGEAAEDPYKDLPPHACK